MAFLNDLDPWAYAATVAAFAVFSVVTFVNLQEWWEHSKIDIFDGRGTLIFVVGTAFLVGAINFYSFHANSPRKTVQGIARLVGKSSSKSHSYEYICATSCQLTGGYALDLRDEASGPVNLGSNYVFTYLEHPSGNAFSGISLLVTEVSDAESGRVLYKMDLANHPYRIAVYLFDFVLVVGAGLLSIPLNRTRHHGQPPVEASELENDA
ncbi:MAG: hypothetical protein JST28_02750 [Acidobacteria bacterium]|nr:hypothetical protein [Acidobacteriota bacterium]